MVGWIALSAAMQGGSWCGGSRFRFPRATAPARISTIDTAAVMARRTVRCCSTDDFSPGMRPEIRSNLQERHSTSPGSSRALQWGQRSTFVPLARAVPNRCDEPRMWEAASGCKPRPPVPAARQGPRDPLVA
jgi:hypothetical protein